MLPAGISESRHVKLILYVHMCIITCFVGSVAIFSEFVSGLGPILLENVACSSTELRLLDCSADSRGSSSLCTHTRDAGVSCGEY